MIPIHQTAKDFAVTAVKLGKRLQTQEREFNELNKQIRAIGATLYALSTAMRKKLQNEKNSK